MTHTSTYTHTSERTLTNIHSQHRSHMHTVYAQHGYAKQKQSTHLPVLSTRKQDHVAEDRTTNWNILSFQILCLILTSFRLYLWFSASAKSADMYVSKGSLEMMMCERIHWIDVSDLLSSTCSTYTVDLVSSFLGLKKKKIIVLPTLFD